MAEELVDVLDAHGIRTGEVLPKSQVHTQELWHGGVQLFITDGRGNMLQQRRPHSKAVMGGLWDYLGVAGHIPAGMSPAEAILMEAHQELGLPLEEDDLTALHTTTTEMLIGDEISGWWHRCHDSNFVTCMPELRADQLSLESRSVAAVRWYSIDQFESEKTRGTATDFCQRPPDDLQLCLLGIAAMRATPRN